MGKPVNFPTVAKEKAPDSFSNLPHSLNGGAEGAAMRLTLHCFHRQRIIYVLMFGYPRQHYIKTRKTDVKHTVGGLVSQNRD